MLMLDRYLVAGGRALDLATGGAIRWRVRRGSNTAMPPLFSTRGPSWLIDFDVRGSSRVEVWERVPPHDPAHDPKSASGGPLANRTGLHDSTDVVQAFRAALSDARDGQPRALDIDAADDSWPRTARLLAREARLAGFVPLAADAFGAVLAQARWRFPSWLKERAIVILRPTAGCRLTHPWRSSAWRRKTRARISSSGVSPRIPGARA